MYVRQVRRNTFLVDENLWRLPKMGELTEVIEISKRFNCIRTAEFKMVEIIHVMRHRGDDQFIQVLNKVCKGVVDKEVEIVIDNNQFMLLNLKETLFLLMHVAKYQNDMFYHSHNWTTYKPDNLVKQVNLPVP